MNHKIAALLRSRIHGIRPRGLIKCEASSGSSGFTGSVETGWFQRHRHDITELLDTPQRPSPSLFELLANLREASRSLPFGPWYRCNIRIQSRDRIEFEYYWENGPQSSIKDLERDIHGDFPQFVLERRFDRELVSYLTDFELNNCLLFFVPTRVVLNQPVTDPLMEIFATIEWQSDINNGGTNQYFARDHEPMTGLPRGPLYEMTHRGLIRIKHAAAAALFEESIALYAHFYPRVEQARLSMRISPLPQQDQSDILDRFYALQDSLDDARATYIRQRIAELEQT